ncbi:hypothetical protein [Streptomyces sp. NPDC006335]|uniref:hypothetical protein n=1 Tax=Streptomyces sp. NPDC006335 TaxID=3156895 RepID=UPI0033A9143D
MLRAKRGSGWERVRDWPAHDGKKGWTTEHHEGDSRSPVDVSTLSDARECCPTPEPGCRTPDPPPWRPRRQPRSYWHDFDHVIAIDHNRVEGTAPNDRTRPRGHGEGGGIWLHMDHGSGTTRVPWW